MNAHDAVDLADGIFENVHDIGTSSMVSLPSSAPHPMLLVSDL